MNKAVITATFTSDIKTVWDMVTDNTNYSWRSDLAAITVVDDKSFIEHTKDGIDTYFSITVKNPYERYEFDIKNKNISGSWRGIFTITESGTQVEFTESITVNKLIMKLFADAYLKKQQSRYIQDLRKALGE